MRCSPTSSEIFDNKKRSRIRVVSKLLLTAAISSSCYKHPLIVRASKTARRNTLCSRDLHVHQFLSSRAPTSDALPSKAAHPESSLCVSAHTIRHCQVTVLIIVHQRLLIGECACLPLVREGVETAAGYGINEIHDVVFKVPVQSIRQCGDNVFLHRTYKRKEVSTVIEAYALWYLEIHSCNEILLHAQGRLEQT